MKFKYSKIIEFDEVKERKRIKKLFNKTWQKRLLAILDNFESGNYQKADELYDALPYCNKEYCPGQEFACPDMMGIVYKAIYSDEGMFEKIID